MSHTFRQFQGWKRIIALGILSAAIAGMILGISYAARRAAVSRLPLAPSSETPYRGASACAVCHPGEYEAWIGTQHALASSLESFREAWATRGQPRSCLKCHTTGYDPQTGQAALEGISCEECHGAFEPNHPPSVMTVAVRASACGDCHLTTFTEWQLSNHAQRGVACVSCHAVHSQAHTVRNGLLACAECHTDRYEHFAHATHAEVGADCESCHMYRPPAESMVEGQVSTGHTFTVGAEACANCHRDTIHTRHEIPDLQEQVSELRADLPSGATERLTRLEQEVDQLRGTARRNLYVGVAAGGVLGAAVGFALAWALIWILDRGHRAR